MWVCVGWTRYQNHSLHAPRHTFMYIYLHYLLSVRQHYRPVSLCSALAKNFFFGSGVGQGNNNSSWDWCLLFHRSPHTYVAHIMCPKYTAAATLHTVVCVFVETHSPNIWQYSYYINRPNHRTRKNGETWDCLGYCAVCMQWLDGPTDGRTMANQFICPTRTPSRSLFLTYRLDSTWACVFSIRARFAWLSSAVARTYIYHSIPAWTTLLMTVVCCCFCRGRFRKWRTANGVALTGRLSQNVFHDDNGDDDDSRPKVDGHSEHIRTQKL